MKANNIKKKIKEYFFVYPTKKLWVRQIERDIGAPLPSIIRYTKELEKEEILKSDIIAGRKVYSAARTSKSFLIEKRLYNIKSLFDSGLIGFLISECSNPTIILFGSYSIGEDVENSDIDIYVEMNKKKINIDKFEKLLKRKIQLFQYKRITDIKNKELINTILNGVTLNGFVEVFK